APDGARRYRRRYLRRLEHHWLRRRAPRPALAGAGLRARVRDDVGLSFRQGLVGGPCAPVSRRGARRIGAADPDREVKPCYTCLAGPSSPSPPCSRAPPCSPRPHPRPRAPTGRSAWLAPKLRPSVPSFSLATPAEISPSTRSPATSTPRRWPSKI